MTTLSNEQMARLLHVRAHSREDDIDRADDLSIWYCRGCRKLHTRCACGDICYELLPAILGTVDELTARAEAAEAQVVELVAWKTLSCFWSGSTEIVAERKAAVLWAEKAEKSMTCKGCGGTVGDHLAPDQGGCPGSFEIDGVQMVPMAGRDNAVAQRDALKAKVDTERQRQNATLAKLREELGADLGCGGGLVEILTGIIGLREQRDALKAKLAALVDAASDFYEASYEDAIDRAMDGADFARRVLLGDAIAAARGGAS